MNKRSRSKATVKIMRIYQFPKNAAPASSRSASTSKAMNARRRYRKIFLLALMVAAIALLVMSGCSRQIDVIPTRKQALPSATVSLASKTAGRYQLKVSHLLAPEELDTAAKYYVIWA